MASKKQDIEDEIKKGETTVEREDPKEDDSVLEVEVSGEDDDEDDEPEDQPAQQPRKQRRAARYDKAVQEAEAAKAEAARVRQQYEQQQAQIAAWQQQQQHAQQTDHFKAEEDKLYEEQELMYAAFQQAGGDRAPKDVLDKFAQRARDLERRKFDLAVRRNGGGQPGPSPQQVAQLAQLDRLKEKYRDIISNEQAYAWAHGERMRRIFQEGAQDSEALLDEVAADARQRFGLNGHGHSAPRRPAPSPATKARFSGVPARGAAPSNGAVTVRIGKAERALAIAANPGLSPEKAIQKWANGPGRRAALAAAADKSR